VTQRNKERVNMTKRATVRGNKRAGGKRQQHDHQVLQIEASAKPKRDKTPIRPLNEAQKRYSNAIKAFTLTFATGPAGTGKTFVCAALAAQALESGEIDKIIITRPAVEAGESMGFLPGEIEEKFDPYLQPFRDVLNERLGKTFVEYLLKEGRIEAAPLAYMRGRTFKNAYVILDEAQNTTPTQMKMFLTRIGENCKIIVNGDMSQKDIPGQSGLEDAVARLSFIPSIKHVRFTTDDIVRSGLVQEIVSAYDVPTNELPERRT
jgi:phosphate starvation-inducible PhoH-like protein